MNDILYNLAYTYVRIWLAGWPSYSFFRVTDHQNSRLVHIVVLVRPDIIVLLCVALMAAVSCTKRIREREYQKKYK